MFGCKGLLVSLYAKKHCPNGLPKRLVATKKEIKLAAKKAIEELTFGASKNGIIIRLAGQSGSGKTTQLLPAAEIFFEKQKMHPVLVAARVFAKYHPHYEEILEQVGVAEIRKRTDDFATIMMYLVVKELTKLKYDLIIDLSFASTKVEAMFVAMTRKYKYKMILMMAVASNVAKKMLEKREWRHFAELEKEFSDSTEKALNFYGVAWAKERLIMWGFDTLEPVYDGEMSEGVSVWRKEISRKKYSVKNIEDLIESKKRHILENVI